MKRKVLVAISHPAVAWGVLELLRLAPGYEVAGGPQARTPRRGWRPDVVLADAPAARRLAPELRARTLVVATGDEELARGTARAIGAAGWVHAERVARELDRLVWVPRRRSRRASRGRPPIVMTLTPVALGAAVVAAFALGGAPALAVLLGTALPLGLLLLGWFALRRRVAVILLAFVLALATNVLYLGYALPADAVTDNTNTFTFRNTTTFSAPNLDMVQGYTPAGAAATCPAADGNNWTCTYASDTFTAGQTMAAATATTSLYLENNLDTIAFRAAGSATAGGGVLALTISKPTGTVSGDLMVAAVAVYASLPTITAPAGWTLVRRMDGSAFLCDRALAVYWKAAGASEPASYAWTLSASTDGSGGGILSFSGVDTTTPLDTENGLATPCSPSCTTTDAPSITTSFANTMVVSAHTICSSATWTPPSGMTEAYDVATLTPPTASGMSIEGNFQKQAAAGATGTKAATPSNDPDAGAAHILALRPAARTCALTETLKLVRTITLVQSASKSFVPAGSCSSAKPCSLAFPSNNAAGDFIVVATAAENSIVATATVSDTLANTYSTAVGPVYASGGGFYIWYAMNVAAGANTVTITWTDFMDHEIHIYEYSGVATAAALDVSASATNGAGSTALNSGNATTTNAADLLFGFGGQLTSAAGTIYTPGASYTVRTTTTHTAVEDRLVSATGAFNAALTSTSSNSWAMLLASFKRATTTLGSATVSVTSPTANPPAVVTTSFATSAVTFATGDRLTLDVTAPLDATNCNTRLWFDGASQQSKLVTATLVPEQLLPLVLLAPALPWLARRWKGGRRP